MSDPVIPMEKSNAPQIQNSPNQGFNINNKNYINNIVEPYNPTLTLLQIVILFLLFRLLL